MRYLTTTQSGRVFLSALAAVTFLFLPLSARCGGIVTNATEAALNAALVGGGTVTFACDGVITFTSTKTITNNIVLDASGRSITLSGGGNIPLFNFGGTITLSNLTLANGKRTVPNIGPIVAGGAINGAGTLRAFNCRFTNNIALGTNGAAGANGGNGGNGKPGGDAWGGAIAWRSGGPVELTKCVFFDNTVSGGQGGDGGNGSGGGDGGNGGAGGDGLGGAILASVPVYLTNCIFAGSEASGGSGGEGGNYGSSHEGDAGLGGTGGNGFGGAIFSGNLCQPVNCSAYGNLALGGHAGDAGIGKTTASTQTSPGGNGLGGGIHSVFFNTFINCTVFGNAAAGGNGGDVPMGNGKGGNGGNGEGGGLYFTESGGSGGTGGITNCTFSSNGAFAGGAGAGPQNGTPGSGLGGNVRNNAPIGVGICKVKNSIFAYASSGGNGSGTITDLGQCISSDATMNLNGTGSSINTDPKLDTLTDDGGFTPVCPLQATSPAINAAHSASAPLLDQRGYYRAYGPDIGAYEYDGSPVNYTFVEIEAPGFEAAEAGPLTGSFTITRTGKVNETNIVALDLSGTAESGVDYTALPTNIVFAPGVTVSNLTVTPLQNAPDEPAETVVLGLKPGTNYLLGLHTNAVVTIQQDGLNYRAAYPLGERYLRGSGTNLDFYTIVVPLSGLKGTARANMETNSPFSTLYHYNGALGGTQTQTNNRIAVNTPVASFGSTWGTALRPGESYSMGIYVGVAYNPVSIEVFYRSNLTYVDSISLEVPIDWIEFATNGFASMASGYGLKTVLRQTATTTWGTGSFGYALTHTAEAGATNYYYVVSAGGQFDGQDAWLTDSGFPAYGYIYDLVFDERPGWRSTFVEQPHFTGEPLPPTLLNKTPEELFNYGAIVTNTVSLSPSACTNLDQSPELRRHPVLDQFVADLNNDPIALANYVQNEIDVTDAIAYRDDGSVANESVNIGGVNRGALGVYLEGQGSPMEQCALLIYLLRQAGYPAAYVFPPDGGLKLLDSRLSELLRMQFAGAQDAAGHPYTTNRLIPANYPWVAVYIGTNWVHVFPWLKQSQVIEGLELRDYLPDPYKETQLWVKDYILGKTNIMAFATLADDTAGTVFQRFLANALEQTAPGISIDDIGMSYVNRRKLYATWDDFPRPTWVTNTSTAVESLTASGITNVSPALTNVFDTVYVELLSLSNPSKAIRTTEMRMVDLHNRKFFLTYTNLGSGQFQAILSLAPWRPEATGLGSFATNDLALTNKQVATVTFDSTDDDLSLRIRHRRQKALSWQTAIDWRNGFLELNAEREVLQERPLRKGELAAICLNAGRVTQAMLRMHAQELWNMEQQLSTNAAAASTISADIYQGSTLYLMGMSYYERVARFDALNRRLNKVQNISTYAMGLAKLSPRRNFDGSLPDGPIDPIWPNVDMFYQHVAVAGNGSVRLDSGWDRILAERNYHALFIADGSAQEHAVLNTFFGQQAAVSTVKVLQLAQAKVATGGPPVVELNFFNYQSAGDVLYGGIPLRAHDPKMWATIENTFNLFSIGWVSPGSQTTPSGSFSGMAALLLGPEERAALIGNDQYGGFGDGFGFGSVHPDNLGNWQLTQNGADYTVNLSPLLPNQYGNQEIYTVFDAPQQAGLYGNNTLAANPFQE